MMDLTMQIDSDAARCAGISAGLLQDAGQLLQQSVLNKQTPGGVFMVGRGETTVATAVAGFEIDLPDCRRPMTLESRFDVASLSKVCATTPAILSLVESGQLLLSDRLAMYFPEYADGPKSAVTVKHLLTHTAGLPPGDALPAQPDVAARWRRVVQIPLVAAPGRHVVYSDIGFMILGRLVELVAGVSLDRFAKDHVFTPLDMKATGYRMTAATAEPLDDAWGDIPYTPPGYAATEMVAQRGRAAYAFVHDENAFSLGGICGHAGLFSTASDLSAYARMWLGHGRQILSRRMRDTAIANNTEGLDGRRGLGWCLRGDAYDHMGDLWSPVSFGHTGFTGTSISMDPSTDIWMVLLTNRVHYGRQGDALRLRRSMHNAVMRALM